jgi:hypothetical protein
MRHGQTPRPPKLPTQPPPCSPHSQPHPTPLTPLPTPPPPQTAAELDDFSEPEFTIFNSGAFPANRYSNYMTSSTSVAISLKHREMVILGTEYAGEMKKGVFRCAVCAVCAGTCVLRVLRVLRVVWVSVCRRGARRWA